MKLLILGGGYTGQHLARCAQAEGVVVHLTNRQGQAITGISAPVFAFDHNSKGKAMPLDEAAYRGITHILSTIPPDSQGQDPVIAGVLTQLERLNLDWFGYLSTTGVYGDTQGAWVDETYPVNPQSLRSQHRVQTETTFLQTSLPTHIFRLPGIYGPSRSIFDRLKAGKAQHIQKPGHVFSRVHVEDIVQTIWQSMHQPTPGSIYNIADDLPSTSSSLLLEACELLGQTAPEAIPFSSVSLNPIAASFWQECRRVSNRKIKADLGVQLKYPSYREGLRQIWKLEQATQG
ncbi:MAG: SDR family oxidoreductase [Acaryochloridaceae cyanobacterium SU_2_1]|nr:SDR family oxidoreductase [Acaryochloridaceae cyanobacterium SU_2_1]